MAKQFAAALALAALACLAARADEKKPSPEPGAKVGQKWEYAELQYSSTVELNGRGRGGAGANPFAGRGGRGGAGGGAGGAGMAAQPKVTARWATAEGETEADSWEALAAKLKAPAAAKGAKVAAHRLKLLNHLGSQGWELVSSNGNLMTFKRKLHR